jgi:hypothetical protein
MAGLVPPAGPKPLRRGEGPAIHVFAAKTWTPGTGPGMTKRKSYASFSSQYPFAATSSQRAR